MGQLYRQADTVLCWLGELSAQRQVAMLFLQNLAKEASRYITLEARVEFWTIAWDHPVNGADVSSVIQSAVEAHAESIYDSDCFTRMWIVQEITLASNLKILSGGDSMSWKELELATRVLASCLKKMSHHPQTLKSVNNAWNSILARGQHALNMRPTSSPPITYQLDQQWSLGRVAWQNRHKKCKDDRDRVYAVLSLTSDGNSLQLYLPKPFAPDYKRSAEWSYGEFWAR